MTDVRNDMDFRESDWEAALGVLEHAEAAQRSRRRKAIFWWSTAALPVLALAFWFFGGDEQTDYTPRTSAVAIGELLAEASNAPDALPAASTDSVEAVGETPAPSAQATQNRTTNAPTAAANAAPKAKTPTTANTSAATQPASARSVASAAVNGADSLGQATTAQTTAVDASLFAQTPKTVTSTGLDAAPSAEAASGNTTANGGGASSSAGGENPKQIPETAINTSILWVEKAPQGTVKRAAPLKLQPVKTGRTAGDLLTVKRKMRTPFRIPAKTYNLVGYVGNTFAFGYGKVKGTGVLDPALGLTGEIRLINRTWLRTGVGMFQVNNVFARKEYLEEQASFGLNYTSTLISTDRLYMLDVPLGVLIDLNQHHGLLVGTGMEMLLTTRNQLQERQVTPFSTSVIDERSDYGYLTGYTAMNGYVQLGYRYRLSRRSSFDAVYSTGWRRMHEQNNIRNARLVMRFNYALK